VRYILFQSAFSEYLRFLLRSLAYARSREQGCNLFVVKKRGLYPVMRRPVSDSSYPVPTSETDRAEELSIAYVSAVAAHAGIKVEGVARKDHGTDMTFKRLRKRRIDGHFSDVRGVHVPCQVKSARSPEWRESKNKNVLAYDLRAKNYNDLVDSTHGFLILMCLPASVEQWVEQNQECLRLYKCCYYWVPGPDDEVTENKHTKTIHIPREQLFTAEILANIVDEAQVRIEP
jgi:hypothetical protein